MAEAAFVTGGSGFIDGKLAQRRRARRSRFAGRGSGRHTIDISKARRDMGYAPVVNHDQGLAQLRARDNT